MDAVDHIVDAFLGMKVVPMQWLLLRLDQETLNLIADKLGVGTSVDLIICSILDDDRRESYIRRTLDNE